MWLFGRHSAWFFLLSNLRAWGCLDLCINCLLVDFALQEFGLRCEPAAWTLTRSIAVPWVHHHFHYFDFVAWIASSLCHGNSSCRVAILCVKLISRVSYLKGTPRHCAPNLTTQTFEGLVSVVLSATSGLSNLHSKHGSLHLFVSIQYVLNQHVCIYRGCQVLVVQQLV